MARRSWSDAIFVALLLCATPSRAEDDAESLVQKGVELRKEKRDAEALQLFREAWAKSKTPRIQAQLALAEQAVGEWIEAEADLEAALSHKEDAWIAKNTEPLSAALETIRGHLGWIVIETNVPSAEARVGGRITKLGRVRVVAGVVPVEVSAEGYATARRTVEVLAGQEGRAMVTLDPVPRPVPPPPEVKTRIVRVEVPAPIAPSPLIYAGATSLGAGVVALGFGAFFGVRTFAKKSTRDAHCTDVGCDPDGFAADREARTAATVSTIAFGVGVAASAVGIALIVRGHGERATVAPQVGPRVAGLSLDVRW